MGDLGPTSFEGSRVQLTVSDPWDLVAPDGSVRLSATVIGASTYAAGGEEERLVLRLDSPVTWRGHMYEFFVLEERHGHGIADDLRLGLPVECSITAIDRDRAEGPEPFDTSWWRGGLAGNATLQALDRSS